MKYLSMVFVLSFLVVSTIPKSYAVDEAACAIWLCLPTGFGQGCGAAKSEFKKRIKKRKSPLPSFSSCEVKSPIALSANAPKVKLTSRHGYSAFVPSYKRCLRWEYHRQGRHDKKVCVKSEIVPAHIDDNTKCRRGNPNVPFNCSQTIQYVETFNNGTQYGNKYYFDSNGNEFATP